jgi:cytochrome c553
VLIVAPKLTRSVTAVVLMAAAFAFFGGYERLREGTRKPFLIHSHMYSNGLLVEQIAEINEAGIAAHSGWVAAGNPAPEALGERIFLAQCSSCHTMDGYQSIRRALPTVADMELVVTPSSPGAAAMHYEAECARCHADIEHAEMVEMLPTIEEIRSDPDFIRELNHGMISMSLVELRDMGETITDFDTTHQFDLRELARPYMPPFVGTDDELEALAAYLASLDRPVVNGGAQ